MKSLPLLAAVLFLLPGLAVAAPSTAQARVFDFSDTVSTTLTLKAWAAHEAGDTEAVFAYTGRCRELYQDEALVQQRALRSLIPADQPERIRSQYALNDVGTCLFILGQTLEREGNLIDAAAAYQLLVTRFYYAQCWDKNGWFWPPADAARARLLALDSYVPRI